MVEVLQLRLAYRLPPKYAEVTKLLHDQQVVTTKEILAVAKGSKVVIHHIRRALKGYGIDIRSRRTLGYWMDDDSKARLRAHLDTALPGQGEQAEVPPILSA
jgi:NADPH-dependent ferric siderophore reductase